MLNFRILSCEEIQVDDSVPLITYFICKGVTQHPLWNIYMSRKGSPLNCQVIHDRQKRMLWRCIDELGSSHNSTVFRNTKFSQHLMLIQEDLKQENLHLVPSRDGPSMRFFYRVKIACVGFNRATSNNVIIVINKQTKNLITTYKTRYMT